MHKTYLSVNDVISDYRKLQRRYKHRKNIIYKLFRISLKCKPVVYSNIPLYLGKGKYSEVLTREHILLQKSFPSDVTPLVLWDEIGMSANQYSHDDPNITSDNVNDNSNCVEVFIRLFRHFYGENNRDMCRLYATDQATGDVCINIRRRFGSVDNLSNFHRWFKISPFYKVNVTSLMIQEDNIVNTNDTKLDKDKKQEYYFGFFPYRWMSKKRYDSHAYSGVLYTGFGKKISFDNWSDNDYIYHDENGRIFNSKLKTNYCPDLRMTREELAEYKAKIALVQKVAKERVFAGK